MARPKKQTPKENPAQNKTTHRVCVAAPMPIECPHCHSTKTTAANGVHYNLAFKTRYEHRVCSVCGFTFIAARAMTADEIKEKS